MKVYIEIRKSLEEMQNSTAQVACYSDLERKEHFGFVECNQVAFHGKKIKEWSSNVIDSDDYYDIWEFPYEIVAALQHAKLQEAKKVGLFLAIDQSTGQRYAYLGDGKGDIDINRRSNLDWAEAMPKQWHGKRYGLDCYRCERVPRRGK